jgi:hypothetical protein
VIRFGDVTARRPTDDALVSKTSCGAGDKKFNASRIEPGWVGETFLLVGWAIVIVAEPVSGDVCSPRCAPGQLHSTC